MAKKPVGKFVHRDQAPVDKAGGNAIATLLTGDETAGRFSVREIEAEPGAVAFPAAPPADNRYLFVVAGEWSIDVGGESRAATEGFAVFVPAGRAYSARLTGTTRGKLLEIAAPVAPK